MILNELDSHFGNKSILITGASGFVGRNLIQTFIKSQSYLSHSLKIMCTTRTPQKLFEQWPNEQSRLQVLDWDIRRPLTERLPKVDFIFHLAGENRTVHNPQQAKLVFDTSVLGTKNLLNATKRLDVKKIIFASSGAIYKKILEGPQNFCESQDISKDELEDDDPYLSGKSRAESICKEFLETSTSQIIIARMFTFVGPYLPLNANFAIGNFFQDCIEKKPITVKSDGNSIRSYQFSIDMVNWLVTMLLKGKSGEIYNVGSSEQISIKNLAERISEVFDNKLGVKVLGDQSPDPVSSVYVPNIEKAKKDLGLTNFFNLDESLLEMLKFMRGNKSNSISTTIQT